jgi:hypothetical protein
MALSKTDVNRIAVRVAQLVRPRDRFEYARPAQAMEILGCKKSYFYVLAQKEGFPEGFLIPDTTVRVWRIQDLIDWMETYYERHQQAEG